MMFPKGVWMKNIFLNGESHQTDAVTCTDLVTQLKISAGTLILEHNRTIIKKELWGLTLLKDGDKVELISLVGGG